jgi:hypothetical protein
MYELCEGKVWRAVEAMIDGLNKYSHNPYFKIDMNTWGRTDGNICFGCASTCALQHLTGIELTPENVHIFHERIKVENKILSNVDLMRFEAVINCLRKGYLGPLFDYFKKDRALVGFRYMTTLSTADWQLHLHEYKTLLIALKEFDI